MEGNSQFGVQLQPIDFALYAQACGTTRYTVKDPREVGNILRQAFTNGTRRHSGGGRSAEGASAGTDYPH